MVDNHLSENKSMSMDAHQHQLNNLTAENQYVTFQIGEEEYGIDIMLVQEITRYSKPTRVHNTNPAVRGVTNFRGKVIPIVDMRRKFSLPESEYDEFTVVIVIEVNQKTVGMIVDRVSDIMSFNQEEIQEVDREFADDIKTEYIKAMAKSNDRIVMLLDPDLVMAFDLEVNGEEVQKDENGAILQNKGEEEVE